MKSLGVVIGVGLLAAGAFVLFVPDYTGAPVSAQEVGFPQQVLFHTARERDPMQQPPAPLPPAAPDDTPATTRFRNVTVLTDVGASEFMRLQQAITAWVAPKEGCAFCHVGNDYASDANPRKEAARTMLRMTRHLNTGWASHVAPSGVTCYTCHRGQPVPPEIWFPSVPAVQHRLIAKQENWVETADTVRKFFPDDGLAEYLYDDQPIAAQATEAMTGHHTGGSFVETKRIYEMMMTMSDGIGVNCGYCHNSRNLQSWKQSTPYRWVAWDAIRMVRHLNRDFLTPVARLIPQTRALADETRLPVLPPRQTGLQTGNGLVLCGTCHLGLTRPLNGANLVDAYPGLGGPVATERSSRPGPAVPSGDVHALR